MTYPPHRYVLAQPNGTETIQGKCRCGERRTWPASLETLQGAAVHRRRGTLSSRKTQRPANGGVDEAKADRL